MPRLRTSSDIESSINIQATFHNYDALEILLRRNEARQVKPSLLRRAYRLLGDARLKSGDLIESITHYERARLAVPFHPQTVAGEMEAIETFWDQAEAELTNDDLIILRAFITGILESYDAHPGRVFYSPSIDLANKILSRIQDRIEKTDFRTKSRFTNAIVQLAQIKYRYLSTEERAAEFGRIVGKALRKAGIERGLLQSSREVIEEVDADNQKAKTVESS